MKKIAISQEQTSYVGQDMQWTEPFKGERKLTEKEYFYHFSRYSPKGWRRNTDSLKGRDEYDLYWRK